MVKDKVHCTYRVTEDFYWQIVKEADKKGLTVPAFTRYVIKKYISEYGTKKTTTP